MDRDEFMELIYETFAEEPDNVLANGIIEAADAYVEHEKAQLFCDGTTKDTISRQAALDAVEKNACNTQRIIDAVNNLPPAQPEPHEGHWIDKGWDGDWAWQIDGRGNCWRVIECSECGKRVLVESSYCPNCGAKMKGAQNG